MATVLVGIALAVWLARPLATPPALEQLRWTRWELALAVLLLTAIVVLMSLP
ncbi:MAG TPA: hypothetical protein VFS67_08595 [Polyangiaceae bacterium]|nr:hypothetical protein [Polyangiaceae bacterium]